MKGLRMVCFSPLAGIMLAETAISPSLAADDPVFQSPCGDYVGGNCCVSPRKPEDHWFQSPCGDYVGGNPAT